MTTHVNIAIDKSSAFSIVLLRVRDQNNASVDLSTLTGTSTFKVGYNSNTAFTLPIATNANGEVIISGNTLQTEVKAGRYVYDVLLSDGQRIVSGLATVNPAVTT